MSKYLVKVNNLEIRRCLTKFRISSHPLPIANLRYKVPYIHPDNRFCKLCTHNELGDEYHVILKCDNSHLVKLRTDFFNNLVSLNSQFLSFSEEQKLIYISSMVEKEVAILFGSFLKNIFKLHLNNKS